MKYIGITFGPIGQIMSQLRRSRQLWAASFFFSEWSRMVHDELVDDLEGEVLLPQAEGIQGLRAIGVGAFPDRIIIRTASDNDWPRVQTALKNVEERHAKGMLEHLDLVERGKHGWTEASLLKALRSRCYARAVSVDVDAGWEALNQALDHAELLAPIPTPGDSPLSRFLLHQSKSFDGKASYLMEGVNDEVRRFESIQDLVHTHPYIAIVHADGNGVGKHLAGLVKEPARMKEFSARMSEFTRQIGDAIRTFGGRALYIGGDDVLAFMPLTSKGGNGATLFDFVDDMNRAFQNAIQQEGLSLRWGLSIGYEKAPLLDLYQEAYRQSDRARSSQSRAAVCLKKHSGQKIEWTMPLEGAIWSARLEQLRQALDVEYGGAFYAGIMHRLNDEVFRMLLDLAQQDADPKQRLEDLFTNTFNEPVHQQPAAKAFIASLREQLADEEPAHGSLEHSSTYGWLRLIHFLNSKEAS